MARTTLLEWTPSPPWNYAAGLHLWGTPKTYMFDECRNDGYLAPFIVIGNPRYRVKREDIHIPIEDDAVSEIHAMIERRDQGRFMIGDSGSTNGTRVDHEVLTGEKLLLVGMNIYIGRNVRLIAVDFQGNVALTVRSVGELCWRLFEMYGGWSEAARRTDVGRQFLRGHAEKYRKGGAR